MEIFLEAVTCHTVDFLNHRVLKPGKIYGDQFRSELGVERSRVKGGPLVSLYDVKVNSKGFLLVPF